MRTVLRTVMRIFFRLLYHELAWTYDLVSWLVSIGQWRTWQRTAFPYLRGGRVLEIAHGTGNLLLDLTALGLAPVGLDASAQMGRLAQAKLRRRGVAAPQVRGRAGALPFAADSFPSLVATFPTEFIVQPEVIAELFRVLRPGGVLVVVPVAAITGPALPDRLADWLFRVTGQSSAAWFAPLLARYTEGGFQVRLERVRLPRSEVTLIIAEKA